MSFSLRIVAVLVTVRHLEVGVKKSTCPMRFKRVNIMSFSLKLLLPELSIELKTKRLLAAIVMFCDVLCTVYF